MKGLLEREGSLDTADEIPRVYIGSVNVGIDFLYAPQAALQVCVPLGVYVPPFEDYCLGVLMFMLKY